MNHVLRACGPLRREEEGGNVRYGHIRNHGRTHAHSMSWHYIRWKEEAARPLVREVVLEASHPILYREGVVLPFPFPSLFPIPIHVLPCPTLFPSASPFHHHCRELAEVEEASRGDHWDVRNVYKWNAANADSVRVNELNQEP